MPGKKLPFTWAIADSSEEGWRPLAWKDLTSDYLNGLTVPKLPADLPAPLDPALGHSIDEVAKEMDKEANQKDEDLSDVRNVLAHLERLHDMRKTLDKIDQRLADGTMRRSLRRLIVPVTVSVTVSGPTANKSMTLTKMPNNEFTGSFDDLKEKSQGQWKFRYYAHGEDYYTPTRTITVVPPPNLSKLEREEERPAYLYYRPGGLSNVTEDDIKGKKQPVERIEASLMGGDVVSIDCPAGTNLTLFGEADKELNSVKLFELPANTEMDKKIKVEGKTFQVTFDDVRQDLQFKIQMLDRDNVRGSRKIKLRPTRDTEPSVDLAIGEWVRKTKDGYMVTPRARIPFRGDIKDDNGLSKMKYVYTVAKVESTAVVDAKALFTSGVFGMILPAGGGVLHGTTFLASGLHEYDKAKNAQNPDIKDAKYYPIEPSQSVQRFLETLQGQVNRVPEKAEYIPKATMLELLAKRQALGFRSLLKEFKFEPDPLSKEISADPIVGDFPLGLAVPNLLAGIRRQIATALSCHALGRGDRQRPRQHPGARRRRWPQDRGQQGSLSAAGRERRGPRHRNRQGRGEGKRQDECDVRQVARHSSEAGDRQSRPRQRRPEAGQP